jgi:transposase InsO family protein
MKYTFVRDEAKNHSVEKLCEVMEISRSSYYAFESKSMSKREEADQRLMPIVQEIFKTNRKAYGYRRVSDELKERGENCGKYKTAGLMRKLNLSPVVKRRFKLTTDSKHSLPIFTNVLNRNFKPSKMNQAWTSDITYIETAQGWLYLAVVMDLYSRTIVGWAMDKNMMVDLVENALKMAISRRKISAGLLLHSDRGSQYASHKYQSLLKQHGIICSMSRKGNCWDNAPMESFFRSLKVECVYQQSFQQREEAKSEIFSYIEGFYNRQRKHSALNYLSPREYELGYPNL